MRPAIFFQPFPCNSSPCKNRLCSSAVQRPVFSPLDPPCPPEEAVAAVAIVTVDFFLLLEDFVDEDPTPDDLPAGNDVAREGAGATEFEGREAVGAVVAITPVERGGMDAVGSATGGRVDMVVC